MKALRILLSGLVVVAALAYLNFVAIPKPQKTQAAWFEGQQHYACGPYLTVLLTPNSETCNGSNTGNIGSYQSSIKVTAAAGSQGAYAVHWKWASYFCPTENPSAPCLQNEKDSSGVNGLTGDNKAFVTAYSPVNAPSGQYAGQVCGYYQNDFAFYVTNNNNPNQIICGISLNNPGTLNNNASWCHTGKSCTVPTPTPTVTPTPTPTVTPTATPTPSVTPTPTVTPTVTPTPTVVPPTPTPTPFGCTSDCNNTTVNVTQTQSQQQQQQQAVLAASVAPASSATQLPSTGAGADVLFGLIGLLPIGFKLRKLA